MGQVTDPFLQTSVPGIFAWRQQPAGDGPGGFCHRPGPGRRSQRRPVCPGRAPGPHAPGDGQRHGQGPAPAGGDHLHPLPQGLSGDLACRRGRRGNGCPKGADYAARRPWTPGRVLTTTLKGADGRLIPVKTSGGVPRDRLLAAWRPSATASSPPPPSQWGRPPSRTPSAWGWM